MPPHDPGKSFTGNVTDLSPVFGKRSKPKPEDDAKPALTEDGLALRLVDDVGDDWRYVAGGWNRWFTWIDGRWAEDKTLLFYSLVRNANRDVAAGLKGAKRIKAWLLAAGTISATERLARSDRRVAAVAEQWDADPLLLNTPGGTADLKTGVLREHRREDFCTKQTAIAPDEACETPLFDAFMDKVTGGNLALQQYLQRFFGYGLTGLTTEHAFAFFFGSGGNGKSTLLNTVSSILGDYAAQAHVQTFMASKQDSHPTDIASLQGARVVVAIETEKGRRWDEVRLKSLTGGDLIKARFMRQDFFTFRPQFKLAIAGNDRPSIGSVDEAIRRRLHLVPFTVTIPLQERIKGFEEKLQPEWPGILAWMVRGCLEWQRDGLNAPQVVMAATDEYLAAEDSLENWLGDCCDRAPGSVAQTSAAYELWKAWAEKAGEPVASQKRFVAELRKKGLETDRQGHQRVITGISLK